MAANHRKAPAAKGDEIARLRKNKGLSQQDLADETDLSRATIIAIEKNGPASSFVIRRLAAYFGVPREQLINAEPPLNVLPVQDPPPVDNQLWFFVGLHSKRKFDDVDAATVEEQLRNLLAIAGLDYQIFLSRVVRANSSIIEVQITTKALHFLLNYFGVSHAAFPKQINMILIPKVVAAAIYSESIDDRGGPLLFPTDPISWLEIAYPYLRFKYVQDNIIGAKRRFIRKAAEKPLLPV